MRHHRLIIGNVAEVTPVPAMAEMPGGCFFSSSSYLHNHINRPVIRGRGSVYTIHRQKNTNATGLNISNQTFLN